VRKILLRGSPNYSNELKGNDLHFLFGVSWQFLNYEANP